MRGLTIGHLAERNAWREPDAEAVVSVADGVRYSVTFAEFDRRCNRVANGLAARGVKQEDTVALYMQNGIEVLETYVGAMKLGALPVPINHRFKAEEVGYVLSDSGASVCIYDRGAAAIIDEVRDEGRGEIETYLYVGTDAPAGVQSYEAFRTEASDDGVDIVSTRLDDAALMYTSGTTGKPKGCVLTHDNIVQNAENTVYEAEFGSEERFLVVTPLFHIAAFALFVDTFYTGATTLLLDEFDPELVMGVLETEAVTGSFLVPTMSRALLDLPEFDQFDLSAFEHYIIGASPSGKALKRAVVESFNCKLYDMFGQTEMSPVTTMLHPEDILAKPDSIGKPVVNVCLKIVDEKGDRVSQGDVGRAAYRGPTVFKEYYEMPETTAAVFDGDWFVSGDLVRRDEDGFVYFLGRHDDMIISGGENIHPAEIEEVLHEHPAIDSAAVVGVPDEQWGERVKAVIVTEPDRALTGEEVRKYVASRLADFKKPREIVVTNELPRNPTGKVIKDELHDA